MYSFLNKPIKKLSVNIRMLSFGEHEHTQTHMAISQIKYSPRSELARIHGLCFGSWSFAWTYVNSKNICCLLSMYKISLEMSMIDYINSNRPLFENRASPVFLEFRVVCICTKKNTPFWWESWKVPMWVCERTQNQAILIDKSILSTQTHIPTTCMLGVHGSMLGVGILKDSWSN